MLSAQYIPRVRKYLSWIIMFLLSRSSSVSPGRGVHDFLVNFSEFAKKCSNEYIFIFPFANPDFRGYVRSGRWVGEVSQTMLVRAGKNARRRKTAEGLEL